MVVSRVGVGEPDTDHNVVTRSRVNGYPIITVVGAGDGLYNLFEDH